LKELGFAIGYFVPELVAAILVFLADRPTAGWVRKLLEGGFSKLGVDRVRRRQRLVGEVLDAEERDFIGERFACGWGSDRAPTRTSCLSQFSAPVVVAVDDPVVSVSPSSPLEQAVSASTSASPTTAMRFLT